jgi:hypothetical protein
VPPPLDRDAADVAPSTKQGGQRTWQAVGQAGTFVPITAHEGRPSVSLSCWASPSDAVFPYSGSGGEKR